MESASEQELVDEFKQYLERFEALDDEPSDFGAFRKFGGRLVKKMRYDEFEPIYNEYTEVAKTYFDSLDRGDTINDIVVKLIRDRATDLIRTSPV